MKRFETPLMNISIFEAENVVTASNQAADKGINALTTKGSDLLNGKAALDVQSIVEFGF